MDKFLAYLVFVVRLAAASPLSRDGTNLGSKCSLSTFSSGGFEMTMTFFRVALLSLAITSLCGMQANAVDRFDAYAGPGVYGPWYNLRAHLGPATYTVSYRALGRTSVTAEVMFVNAAGNQVRLPFNGSITFRTGNYVAAPQVRFRGIPFGSAVQVTVSP